MKIVISPDSFKESLSSKQVCTVIKKGLSETLSDVDFELIPIADGGEGMMQTLCDVLPNEYASEISSVEVRHPFIETNSTISARFAFIPHKKLIIVESAEAVGTRPHSNRKTQPFVCFYIRIGRNAYTYKRAVY